MVHVDVALPLASSVHWFSDWKLTGNYTAINLVAATTNALNGALLARRPDHYRNFTRVGIVLMALIGGLSGGIIRDVLLNHVPTALLNPAFLTFCLAAGVVGYLVAYKEGQLFREGLFQFMTSFSLPWFAIVGAQAAIHQGVTVAGALLLAVVAATAGRWLIDVSCNVPPKQFIRGEWFVTTAVLTGLVWIVVDSLGAGEPFAAGAAFAVGFTLRVLALYYGWEEPLASEPKGVYKHGAGRPLLGRKIAGKSQRELQDLGLTVNGSGSEGAKAVHTA
jgi:uncharacterized membrane protein YeiH